MIYIVRHGKTENNKYKLVQGQTDTKLSNEGIEDIYKFSNEFKKLGIKFDCFYSSPLLRAKNTLEIILESLGYDKSLIKVDKSLNERFFGEAEGIKYDSIDIQERICNDYYQGMEKNKDLEKRVYDGILSIAKENINKNILIVSHSHAIKAFIRNIDKSYPYFGSTKNLNINVFDFDGNSFKIIEVNKDLI